MLATHARCRLEEKGRQDEGGACNGRGPDELLLWQAQVRLSRRLIVKIVLLTRRFASIRFSSQLKADAQSHDGRNGEEPDQRGR